MTSYYVIFLFDKNEKLSNLIIYFYFYITFILQVVCLQLINSIISSAEDLDFRLHLRNEVMRVGLADILEMLEKDESEDLATHLKIFNDHKEEDYEEFVQRFDNVRLELDDVNDCFEVVKNMVMDTSAEPYFLSILQHLLFIRDDALVR